MRTVDCFVIAIYLIAVFGLGLAFRGKKQNVDDYFMARGVFKGPLGSLIIGLSTVASFLSGITMIALNSSAYTSGAKVVMFGTCPFIVLGVVRYWFLPRYLAADNRHPYDIVEKRFGYPVRAFLSFLFVLVRIGWMSLIIYAPTLIIIGALGLGDVWTWPIVLAIGISCTLFSAIGGIRSVIITDAVQFSLIMLGLAFIIGTILVRLHSPLGAMLMDLRSHGRLHVIDFSPSLFTPWTFWAVAIGSSAASCGQYMADQMALQRYLAAGSPVAVQRSFLVAIAGGVVKTVLLVSVGLLLFIWYLHNPDPALPRNIDMVLPYFAVRQLPPGVSGLLIAAFLAATMNSLTSSINSLAGAVTNDFIARLGRKRSPAELFHWGRRSSIAIGLVATLSAGFAGHLGSVLDASNIILGILWGPMLACMVWAASRAAVRPRAVVAGMLLGAIASSVAASQISSFWMSAVGFVVAILIPWIDSFFAGRRDPAGEVGALAQPR